MLCRNRSGGARRFVAGAAVLVLEAAAAAMLAARLYSAGVGRPVLALLVAATPLLALALALLWRSRDEAPPLLPLLFVLPLNLLGLAVLAVDAPDFAVLQALWSLAGCTAYFALAALMVHLDRPKRLAQWPLVGAVLLLGATFAYGTHPSGLGPKQWLAVGPVYFQPSEAVKLSVIPLLAVLLASPQPNLGPSRAWLLAPLLAVAALVVQGDLGAAAVVGLVMAVMLLGAPRPWRWLLWVLLAGGIAGALGWHLVPRARLRLSSWLDPWADPYGISFQVLQSLRALAAGGTTGKGLFARDTLYVPALHTDMILAGVGERLGLVGTLAVVALMLGLLRHMRVVASAGTSSAGRLLSLGTATLVVGQAALIMAGATAMLPLTGVTLPFVSYGGSSLLVSYGALGLLARCGASPAGASRAVSLPARQRAAYLGLAGALGAITIWLVLWHLCGSAILVQRLPPG